MNSYFIEVEGMNPTGDAVWCCIGAVTTPQGALEIQQGYEYVIGRPCRVIHPKRRRA